MREKNRNIEKEKWCIVICGLMFLNLLLFVITTALYLVIKIGDDISFYWSLILAGASGGIWGAGISKGIDYYQKIKDRSKSEWGSFEEFQNTRRLFIRCIIILLFVLIIEIFIIQVFKLD